MRTRKDATDKAYGEEHFKAAQEAKISEVSHLIARRKRDELIAPGGEERITGNEGRTDFYWARVAKAVSKSPSPPTFRTANCRSLARATD